MPAAKRRSGTRTSAKTRASKTGRLHRVKFQTPELSLGNSDLVIEAWDRQKKVGTLYVSRGGVQWAPFNSPKHVNPTRSWRRFSHLMRADD